MGAQTAGQINGWYANRYFFDGKVEEFEKQPAEISAVTKEQIIDTARQFFSADCWTFGGYGNAEKAAMNQLADQLRELFKK